jgi:hypothetical protein
MLDYNQKARSDQGGNKMNRRIFTSACLTICLIAVNLVGCISTHQVVPVATGSIATNSARIVVKRESAYAGSGAPMFIVDSGKQIGFIASGGELIWDRIAGPMELTAFYDHIGNGNPVPVRISVEPGMSYLFMVSPFDGKHPSVKMISQNSAPIASPSASAIPLENQNILGISVGPTSGVRGVSVITVASGSPCKGVLKPGDTIFAFDLIGQGDSRVEGAKVNADNFRAEVSKIQPGMTVKLLISLRPIVEASCTIPVNQPYATGIGTQNAKADTYTGTVTGGNFAKGVGFSNMNVKLEVTADNSDKAIFFVRSDSIVIDASGKQINYLEAARTSGKKVKIEYFTITDATGGDPSRGDFAYEMGQKGVRVLYRLD